MRRCRRTARCAQRSGPGGCTATNVVSGLQLELARGSLVHFKALPVRLRGFLSSIIALDRFRTERMDAGEGDGPQSAEEEQQHEETDVGQRPRRRFSLGLIGRKLSRVAVDVGEQLARTAAAAGELIIDSDLRGRSAALLAEGASKAAAGVGKGGRSSCKRLCLLLPCPPAWTLLLCFLCRVVGRVGLQHPKTCMLAFVSRPSAGLQHGAGRIAAGPRTVQGILQKLQQRIEEQRMAALLQEQQDTPVDVQASQRQRQKHGCPCLAPLLRWQQHITCG